MTKYLLIIVNLYLTLLVSSVSHAQLGQNIALGNAKAISLAHAVTADPPGIDAIHFNPAGLTRLKGRQIEIKALTIDFTTGGEISRSEKYQGYLDFSGIDDPVVNARSETSTTAIMLPKLGLTDSSGLIIALGGISYHPADSKFTFANAVYAPYQVGYRRDENDPLEYQGNALAITRLTFFAPSVGYRINDRWSVGASIGFSYTGFALDLDMRIPNEALLGLDILIRGLCEGDLASSGIDNVINLCGGAGLGPFTNIGNMLIEFDDPISLTYNLGVLWDVTEWLTWGAVYQSSAKDTMTGDFTFDYSDDWTAFFGGLDDTSIGEAINDVLGLTPGKDKDASTGKIHMSSPPHFSTGISVKVTHRMKVNVDAKWTDSSVWKNFTFEIDEDVDFLSALTALGASGIDERTLVLSRGYKSTWSWAMGFEYQYNSRLALRCGYEDRTSAVPSDKTDILAPFGAATFIGLGFSYQRPKGSLVELSVGQLKSRVTIPSESSTSINSLAPDNFLYNPYAGYDAKSFITAYFLEFSYRRHF